MSAREDYENAYRLVRVQERLMDDFVVSGEWMSWMAEATSARITLSLMSCPEKIRSSARLSRYYFKRVYA